MCLSMAKNRRLSPLARLERPVSLVGQVEQALRRAVAEQVFADGRLPTEVELAEQFGVSRETVRRAAEVLQQEGLLRKYRRRGTIVQGAASGAMVLRLGSATRRSRNAASLVSLTSRTPSRLIIASTWSGGAI